MIICGTHHGSNKIDVYRLSWPMYCSKIFYTKLIELYTELTARNCKSTQICTQINQFKPSTEFTKKLFSVS